MTAASAVDRFRRACVAVLFGGLAACQTLHPVNDDRLPEVVALEDGSPQRAAMNARVYDASVGLVTRAFYDREFNGVDFRAEAAARREAAVSEPDEAGFYRVLNGVLGLLDDRHTLAMPPTLNRSHAQTRLSETRVFGMTLTHALEPGSGERRALVTDVRQDGPAAEAGVRRGWRIAAVDGAAYDPSVNYAGALRRFTFADADGEEHLVEMEAQPLRREVGAAERRDDGVLVLRFNLFDRAAQQWMLAQLADAARDPPVAVIVDLRGNGGGRIDATAAVLGAFFQRPVRFAHYNLGPVPRVARRTRVSGAPWTGRAAVLQSGRSSSAAEAFAAAFQEYGRGPVVGQTSAGAVVGSVAYQLPDGGQLRVGVSEFRTGSGAVLEKAGVSPDIQVTPSYEDMARGRDVTLEVAIRALLATPDQAASAAY
ncbi:hypothetical protein E4M02_10240 [Brevundimonas sp. S30B]|uniref:S41 family peptidase n=1 Tax=unclassified Brevundimonas TaxID=2622653 RepID=UPI001072A9A4|nr:MULTISPECIES: S41 family peptidase [unclassified Brevundimonas]QBX38208.1 hypothetical protein E4M01_10815 [Brevundimonas sp. MF30-B]TFW01655.1 hypothetical protein E4M02_10240 [Brevundimonas sp. S30B]